MKSRRIVSTRSRSVTSRLMHERLPVAVGHELHREHVFAAPRLPQDQRLAVVLPLQVVDELRLAHQVGDALPEVARAVEAEVLLGHGIAPLDAVGRVQYDQAVGHGRARLLEILERGGQPRLALALPAQHPVEIAEDAVPQAAPRRHRFRDPGRAATGRGARCAAGGAGAAAASTATATTSAAWHAARAPRDEAGDAEHEKDIQMRAPGIVHGECRNGRRRLSHAAAARGRRTVRSWRKSGSPRCAPSGSAGRDGSARAPCAAGECARPRCALRRTRGRPTRDRAAGRANTRARDAS